jgi:hypothetical protein
VSITIKLEFSTPLLLPLRLQSLATRIKDH